MTHEVTRRGERRPQAEASSPEQSNVPKGGAGYPGAE
jgi:hypothetical protein